MEGVENFRDSELQTFSHLFLPSLFSLSRDLPFLLAISWGWMKGKGKILSGEGTSTRNL